MRKILPLALCAVLSVAPAAAVEWRQAELWGGDVRSLAIDPEQPERVFAGTSSGQVLLSENGGADWRAPGLPVAFPGWVVSDLLLDADGRLWAALWGLWGSGGNLYVSADGGATWAERSEGLPGSQVYRLAAGKRRLYAATRGGVYGSDDGGTSWRHLTAAHPEIEKVSSLLVDGDMVIAGTWRRAYKSDDGGASWRGVFSGMVLDSEVFSMQPGPAAGEIWASTCGWVYRSTNEGESWRRYQRGFEERRTQAIRVLPGGRLLAGTVAGLYVSDDGGASWSRRTSPDLVIGAIAHVAARPQRVYLGAEGSGVWISDDGGDSFRQSNRGLTAARVADLVPLASGEVLAAVRHAGPDSGIYSSRDGGLSFRGPSSGMPTVLELAAAAERPLAATEKGLFERQYGEWRLVTEVGRRRIDQVSSSGGLTVARSGKELFRLAGERFVPIAPAGAEPRAMALAAGELWVGDGEARLWRFVGDRVEPEAAPFAGGRLGSLSRGLLLAGDGGAYLRRDADSPWQPLADAPSRGLSTGDDAYPLLLMSDSGARLLEREKLLLHRVPLPVPLQDVTAATVVDGRLLVATAGHGIVRVELSDLLDAGAEPWARLTTAR